jgi:hypothetical protein
MPSVLPSPADRTGPRMPQSARPRKRRCRHQSTPLPRPRYRPAPTRPTKRTAGAHTPAVTTDQMPAGHARPPGLADYRDDGRDMPTGQHPPRRRGHLPRTDHDEDRPSAAGPANTTSRASSGRPRQPHASQRGATECPPAPYGRSIPEPLRSSICQVAKLARLANRAGCKNRS